MPRDTAPVRDDDSTVADMLARLFQLPAPGLIGPSMPSMQNVARLLERRRGRAIDEWRARLEDRIGDASRFHHPALVRILHGDKAPGPSYEHRWKPGHTEISAAAATLHVTVLRHLGEDEFLISLHRVEDQNELALAGHLDVTRGAYRMIAI